MGLSHAGQRRAGGAPCPWASALLFPGGGRRAGSSQRERGRCAESAGARPGSGFSPAAGSREGSSAFLPTARSSARRPRWSEAGVKCCPPPERERRSPLGYTASPISSSLPARGALWHSLAACRAPTPPISSNAPADMALRHPPGSLPASTPPLRARLCSGAEGCAALCRDHAVSGRPRISAVKLEVFVLRKLHTRLRASSVCTVQTSEVFLAGVFQSREEDDRKVRRREKNRVAAQRSRKKQTQKADKLHEVNGYLVLCRHGLGTKHGTLQ